MSIKINQYVNIQDILSKRPDINKRNLKETSRFDKVTLTEEGRRKAQNLLNSQANLEEKFLGYKKYAPEKADLSAYKDYIEIEKDKTYLNFSEFSLGKIEITPSANDYVNVDSNISSKIGNLKFEIEKAELKLENEKIKGKGDITLKIGEKEIKIAQASFEISKDSIEIEGETKTSNMHIYANDEGKIEIEADFKSLAYLIPGYNKIKDYLSDFNIFISDETKAKLVYDPKNKEITLAASNYLFSYKDSKIGIAGPGISAKFLGISLKNLEIDLNKNTIEGYISADASLDKISFHIGGMKFSLDTNTNYFSIYGDTKLGEFELKAALSGRYHNNEVEIITATISYKAPDDRINNAIEKIKEGYKKDINLGNSLFSAAVKADKEGKIEEFNKLISNAENLEKFAEDAENTTMSNLSLLYSKAFSAVDRLERFRKSLI